MIRRPDDDKRRYFSAELFQTTAWLAVLALLATGLFFFEIIRSNIGLDEKNIGLGVTFSKIYAEDLGLDWKAAYIATLDDLGARRLRIPAYWTDIEPVQGAYDFSVVDWQLAEAGKRDVKVILAVGRKLPRWPECHVPRWAEKLDEQVVQSRILKVVEATVKRYAGDPAVAVWQVENEPFFDFGVCPKFDEAFLKKEIALVRSLDKTRPVMITESGELSTWVPGARLADIVGISTYRVVWNKLTGYFFWPITPQVYRQRASVIRPMVENIIISELQGEPWTTGPIVQLPIARQLELLDADRLRSNVVFARRMGMDEAYLWGIEWWYWLKLNGFPELWDAAKEIFRQAATAAKAEGMGF